MSDYPQTITMVGNSNGYFVLSENEENEFNEEGTVLEFHCLAPSGTPIYKNENILRGSYQSFAGHVTDLYAVDLDNMLVEYVGRYADVADATDDIAGIK